ncbi:lytic polysaccharide monooxygenase [Streptomyces peucetius]|uniref:Lytic polysaccharide monooxygenase n=1 Tax=Streptomyces peucetius TaxID=1950 RepID=A0ABY6IGF6_STRPE|nr:lytic polysaccharide monooxygenase [Streptomyces peucetius]UYQ66102.1 lytic polysaccharide monooxygenase [Streptomyces peucetius]
MTGRRRITAVAAPAGAVFLVLLAAAGPARAHGAPTDPVSRTVVCGVEGAQRASGACRAAVAANGGAELGAWDDLRLPGVADRDRAAVPDGQLCSAGLAAYRGLDVARADWPATPLTAGGPFTLTYRSSIPHRGTFQLYLTEQGYDPAAPLRWADLEDRPFATVTDPVLEDGAYRISGRLPSGLTGRHVLYTVWRNTDTPDTYYSCSDVVLTPDEDPRQSGAQPGPPPPPPPPAPPSPAPPASSVPASPPASAPASASAPSSGRPGPAVAGSARAAGERSTILAGVGAAALALVLVCGSAALRRRNRNRT